MRSTHRTLALSVLTGLLGLGALTGTARATGTDQVVHPNSACRWSEDWYRDHNVTPAAYVALGWLYFQFAEVEGGREVTCGIDRFNLTNSDGLRDLDLRFKSHRATDAEVSCTAYSLRPDGTVVKSVTLTATIAAGAAYRLDYNGALNQSVSYGAYAVSCAMPGSVALVNILQREYE